MEIDRIRAEHAFDEYVGHYDASNARIKLKIDHTYRVAELAERIANSLGLPSDDIDLAWLCGLLHDIGRFEQVRRFDTFSDARSVPHAALSVEVLLDEGHVRDFIDEDTYDGLIRCAVATHSDYRLPPDLDLRTRMFCDILRDADKIDILKASDLEPDEAIFGVPTEEIAISPLSPPVIETFYAHHTVLRAQRAYPADILVSFACFVFELVYPESARIARDQGYAFKMLQRRFKNAETAARFRAMDAHLHEWLDERIKADTVLRFESTDE